jgi:translation initiation factor 5A
MSDEEKKEEPSPSYDTIPTQASTLKKGTYLIIKGFPCKIVDITTSKTGKHGCDKVRLTGIDIFTGTKYEDAMFSTAVVNLPVIKRKEYEFLSYEPDGTVKLLSVDTKVVRTDLKVKADAPEASDLKAVTDSKKKALVLVLETCGKEMVCGVRMIE